MGKKRIFFFFFVLLCWNINNKRREAASKTPTQSLSTATTKAEGRSDFCRWRLHFCYWASHHWAISGIGPSFFSPIFFAVCIQKWSVFHSDISCPALWSGMPFFLPDLECCLILFFWFWLVRGLDRLLVGGRGNLRQCRHRSEAFRVRRSGLVSDSSRLVAVGVSVGSLPLVLSWAFLMPVCKGLFCCFCFTCKCVICELWVASTGNADGFMVIQLRHLWSKLIGWFYLLFSV